MMSGNDEKKEIDINNENDKEAKIDNTTAVIEHPKIIIDNSKPLNYFDLYPKYKNNESNINKKDNLVGQWIANSISLFKTAAGSIQETAKAAKIVKYGSAAVNIQNELTRIRKAIVAFGKCKTFEACVDLILELRKTAAYVQNLKYAGGQSVFSATLHGVAGIYLCALKKHPHYNTYIAQLISDIKDIKIQYKNTNNTHDMTMLDLEKIETTYFNLVALGKLEYINKLNKRKTLNNNIYIFPEDLNDKKLSIENQFNFVVMKNKNVPLVFQEGFAEEFYNHKFYNPFVSKVSFEKFMTSSTQKNKLSIKRTKSIPSNLFDTKLNERQKIPLQQPYFSQSK